MSTTTISGTINGVNNTALANKWINFRLVQLGTDSGATATVAQSVDSVQTDANGDFSIDVWNNGDSGKTSVLEITIDGSKAENVIIPTGTASIELWDLIENYQADGSTSEQVPVVSALFVRKSNNLSDLGSAPTSRSNLGVAIGTNVQAHSSVLDATTASFTTADETKLDGVEALADVTNATNIAASGGYVAGGTDVALTDGGTGASDAPTARTNLDVPSNDETVLVANNLSELTPTAATARSNLGVAIGLNVQAHSAVLDATTASFTTAIETAVSTNTANISSNDTDIGILTGSVVQNQTDISNAESAIVNNTIAINDKVPNASTTGTANATTFLRGDNTWSEPVGIGTAAAYPYTSYIRSNVFSAKNFKTITNLDIFNADLTLSSIYIGGNCVTIDEYAFDGCTNLEDLTLAEGVITLGSYAFQNCTSLESPGFPTSLQTIGVNTFSGCSLITSVDTGPGVTSVGTGAFRNNIGLESAILGNSVVSTGQSVFNGCTSLTSITLGNSVEIIGPNFAEGSTLLTAISIPDSVNEIGYNSLLNTGITFTTINDIDYLSSPSYSFMFNGSSTVSGSLIIPETVNGNPVRVISDGSFTNNSNITSLTIPSGVIRIGGAAFQLCSALSSISCLAAVAPDLGNNGFTDVLATTIDVPVAATGYGVTYGGLTVNYVL